MKGSGIHFVLDM